MFREFASDDGATGGASVCAVGVDVSGLLPAFDVNAVADVDAVVTAAAVGVVDCVVVGSDPPTASLSGFVDAVDEVAKRVPVVVVTHGGDGAVADALAAGADEVVDVTRADAGDVLAHRVHRAVEYAGSRRALGKAEEFFEQALDSMMDAFYVFDETGRCRYWNSAFADVTGLSDAELEGRPAPDFVVNADRERIARAIAVILETGAATVEVDLETATGDAAPYELTGTRLTDADGDVIGFCGVGRDVSGRERRERELRRQAEQLSVLNRVLRHDIRTTANIVAGYAETLPDHLSAADEIAEAAHDLVALGERARELERAFETDVTKKPFDLGAHLRRTVDDLEDTYDATFSTFAPNALWVSVSDRVPFVFENVLENAAEHNEGDTQRVDVVAREEHPRDGGPWAVVEVHDDGPGIPEHEREVFDATAETPLSHSDGLGLWLVNWLVEDEGGTVTVDTGPEGTVVVVRLPLADEDDRRA
ncbi:PAS domain S-box protein [Halorubellus salinus]|uniref:PAS domain S-box protein n=1 Tax=Halorubellus salinus TaxID=755309 RepID=UPI001D08653C